MLNFIDLSGASQFALARSSEVLVWILKERRAGYTHALQLSTFTICPVRGRKSDWKESDDGRRIAR
jgi:hypothetical protein